MKEANRDILISALAFGIACYFSKQTWILVIAPIYLLSCWLIPFLKNLNHQFWKGLTRILQSIMNPILLGIIFFLVLTPLGMLFRVFGKKRKVGFEKLEKVYSEKDFHQSW
jgi:hypothetical protein